LVRKGVSKLSYISKIMIAGLMLASITVTILLAADEQSVVDEIPKATIHYGIDNRASVAPLLTWDKNP